MNVIQHRMKRLFVSLFLLGVVICAWAFFSAVVPARDTRGGRISVERRLLGVTLISVSRSGREIKIRPHVGVPLVLVAVPAFGVFVRYMTVKRQ